MYMYSVIVNNKDLWDTFEAEICLWFKSEYDYGNKFIIHIHYSRLSWVFHPLFLTHGPQIWALIGYS